MSDDEIEKLKTALKTNRVLWNPNENTAKQVSGITMDPDGGRAYAMFSPGKYVSLYNCELRDFIIVTNIF